MSATSLWCGHCGRHLRLFNTSGTVGGGAVRVDDKTVVTFTIVDKKAGPR